MALVSINILRVMVESVVEIPIDIRIIGKDFLVRKKTGSISLIILDIVLLERRLIIIIVP